MAILILGLVLFLGVHSTRIAADGWRKAQLARRGPKAWKGIHALLSLVGLILIVVGYRQVAEASPLLWELPDWTRHPASILMMPAFVLLVAAYVPGNKIKPAVKHPMVLGVIVWALSHLITTGTVAGATLFGAFLVWATLSFRAARGRDRAEGVVYPAGRALPTVAVVAIALGLQVSFALALHGILIGKPLL